MSEATSMTVRKIVPVYHLELVQDREVSYNGAATTTEQAADIFHQLMDKSPVETMWVLYLNGNSDIVGAEQVGLGDTETVHASLTTVFRGAIQSLATQIVAGHFHPSGVAKPSDQDIMYTDELLHIGEHLHVKVLDHLVIARGGHYSIKENWQTLLEDFQRKTLEQALGGGKFLDRLKEEVSKMMGKKGGDPFTVLDIPVDGFTKKGGDPKANDVGDYSNTLSYLWEQMRDKTTV